MSRTPSQIEDLWFTDSTLPILAISGDDEHDSVICLHYRRPATNDDRDQIIAALNAALTSAPAPEDRTREVAAIKLADGYGIVLAMIAAGCSDPQRFAKRMLAEYAAEAKRLEITK